MKLTIKRSVFTLILVSITSTTPWLGANVKNTIFKPGPTWLAMELAPVKPAPVKSEFHVTFPHFSFNMKNSHNPFYAINLPDQKPSPKAAAINMQRLKSLPNFSQPEVQELPKKTVTSNAKNKNKKGTVTVEFERFFQINNSGRFQNIVRETSKVQKKELLLKLEKRIMSLAPPSNKLFCATGSSSIKE